MDVLTFETRWALNSEIIKQVTSSWSIFIQLSEYRFNSCWLVNCEHWQSERISWARSCTGAEERNVKRFELHESVTTVQRLKSNRQLWFHRHIVRVCAHATALFLNTNANLDWWFRYLPVGRNCELWDEQQGGGERLIASDKKGRAETSQRQSLL